MFTEAYRNDLRDALIEKAGLDQRLVGVALTGSSSTGSEDRWSDIDLAFGVASDQSPDQVIADWTQYMHDEHRAVANVDVVSRATVYRVFLLANSLQVDIAFAPEHEFGAVAPTFRLVSGTAHEQPRSGTPDVGQLIGMAWLYALHARTSIVRGRPWQAEHMISALRDQVVMLACVRHQVPAQQGRGVDMLPRSVTESLQDALVRNVDDAELVRAFGHAMKLLIDEVEYSMEGADSLIPVLEELVRTADPQAPQPQPGS
jgi:hypothetical protein